MAFTIVIPRLEFLKCPTLDPISDMVPDAAAAMWTKNVKNKLCGCTIIPSKAIKMLKK